MPAAVPLQTRCPNCQKSLVGIVRIRGKFCTDRCYSEDLYKTKLKEDTSEDRAKNNWKEDLTKGTIGAVHELMVSADLLRRGYNVFRAMSPSCPCDLIISKGAAMYRVEVTTATRLANGTLYRSGKNKEKFEILALVEYSGIITYLPCLPEEMRNATDRS